MAQVTCRNCGGTGEIFIEEWGTHVPCRECKGSGMVEK